VLEVIQAGALNVGGGQKAGASIASMPASSRPTAVFCANDLIALGVLQEMTRNHIRVPEDISILGYDDAGPQVAIRPGGSRLRSGALSRAGRCQ
jgi:LacI family transcriptional regulator